MPAITKTNSKGQSVTLESDDYIFIENSQARAKQDEFFDWLSNTWMVSTQPNFDKNIFYRKKIKVETKDRSVEKTEFITVSQEQFKQIIDIICVEWKDKLAKEYYDFFG